MGAEREITVSRGLLARRMVHAALDVLFPPLCMSCRARLSEPHALCASCWTAISFIEEPLCAVCGMPFDIDPGGETICGPCQAKPRDLDKARSLLRYDAASKPLILSFKHSDRLDQAPAFARWIERSGRSLLNETDLIVPVPLHRWRRRYNRAAILAERLARLCARPHDSMALERKRPTASQGRMLSAKAQRRNVPGAFRVPPGKTARIKGRAILLVDDVFTTGATLDACARALKRAGAARVNVLTMARVVRPGFSDI